MTVISQTRKNRQGLARLAMILMMSRQYRLILAQIRPYRLFITRQLMIHRQQHRRQQDHLSHQGRKIPAAMAILTMLSGARKLGHSGASVQAGPVRADLSWDHRPMPAKAKMCRKNH
jgi:hypothetical protein